jgi:hypothetical protein
LGGGPPASLAEEPIVRPVVPGRARELAFHCDEEPAAGPRRKAAVREVLATARAGRALPATNREGPLCLSAHGRDPRPAAWCPPKG